MKPIARKKRWKAPIFCQDLPIKVGNGPLPQRGTCGLGGRKNLHAIALGVGKLNAMRQFALTVWWVYGFNFTNSAEVFMYPVIQKTLGGLSSAYYFRQLFFGSFLAAFFFMASTQGGSSVSIGALAFIICNTFLYPYSRFVYEGIVNFVMGNNVFFVNAVFMLIAKIFTMVLCWSLALLVAPIGFAYLYYSHGKSR